MREHHDSSLGGDEQPLRSSPFGETSPCKSHEKTRPSRRPGGGARCYRRRRGIANTGGKAGDYQPDEARAPLGASSSSAQTKTPRGCPHGVFEKPGDTYFRECSHYHRPKVLNYCVRNGNRCFHHGMVARKSAGGGKTRPHLTFWNFELEWVLGILLCRGLILSFLPLHFPMVNWDELESV